MTHHTLTPPGGSRGPDLAEEKPNPLTAHLLQLVQGRQQGEVAKLTLLSSINEKLDEQLTELRSIRAALDELTERARER